MNLEIESHKKMFSRPKRKLNTFMSKPPMYSVSILEVLNNSNYFKKHILWKNVEWIEYYCNYNTYYYK